MSGSPPIPEKYDHLQIEEKWGQRWSQLGLYSWDSKRPRNETFVIDTPPPTVSGSLHVGHVFSYTQTDVIARFQRMKGKNIFYPMGWDDNGLPTERRVQNYFNIRCDPSVPYDPNWKVEKFEDEKTPKIISRQNFIEACSILTKEDEAVFEQLWRRLGLSIDWSQQYATIDHHCRKISQLSFLDLFEKNQAYNAEAPTTWDVDFKSAVAQAEIEDREIPGAFHDIRFAVEGGEEFVIATTRPELLASCIAVVAHPDDERYKGLFGKNAITPLFHSPVPIRSAEHANPEKGTGILMVCTFGDLNDVEWWKQSGLPMKQIIGLEGRILPITYGEGPFVSQNVPEAQKNFTQIARLTVKQAQKKMVELLSEEGSAVSGKGAALANPPKPVTHPVKFFEKGDRPLEFVSTRQWFIKTLEHREALIEQGRKIQWHPHHMLHRYEHWVLGLNQDWCISRQRFFGVPFPVWYPIDKNGITLYDKPIFPSKESLPVDPSSAVPPGFSESQRNQPAGFAGDPDVMDTWATSALTPQLMSHWGLDDTRHKKLFPMDIRPQAHEIIRTWAFSSIVKAWMHENEIPWKHAIISGWILDPDRKKMSKSKGNVVTPGKLLEEYSSDAVRYWAAKARLGADTAFDEGVFKIGRKLTTKIFNASRFVLLQFERITERPGNYTISDITEPLDQAVIGELGIAIQEATRALEVFEYAQALQTCEDFFWKYCDHYLELVKARSYEENDSAGRRSAFATLSISLEAILKLFAPVLPYITEEIWSWSFQSASCPSVHTASWPDAATLSAVSSQAKPQTFSAAIDVISQIRGAKTEAKRSLKWKVEQLVISGTAEDRKFLEPVLADVLQTGNVVSGNCSFKEGAKPAEGIFSVQVTLANDEA